MKDKKTTDKIEPMKGIFSVFKNNLPVRQINVDCRRILLESNRMIATNNSFRLYECTLKLSAN